MDPTIPDVDAWQSWHPDETAALLADCPVSWCVAGGWAIDLHVGRQTREHSDLEIAIPRTQFGALRPYLEGFELFDVGAGALTRLGPGDEPNPEHHQVWACDMAIPAWRMDTFLEPGDEETWVSHRDDRIQVPRREAVRHTSASIPYLSPEIVLFTKAKHVRDKDDADLATVLPMLDQRQRAWLAEAIGLVHPDHRWLGPIRG